MESLRVRGGRPLEGTIEISGAKNAVLPVMAAAVLHGGKYVLHNCPRITDVDTAAEILESLGGRVSRQERTLTVDTRELSGWILPASLMAKMRASVLFLGALLGRFGRAVLTMPGGCPLGRRPIDLHLEALSQMGAAVMLREGQIYCEAPELHGSVIELPFPSVGATENVLLAAAACRGTVTLLNAAREPEVVDLACFLRAMGADIRGEGTRRLIVSGGMPLRDADHTILPDRIETATYLCAGACCGGHICLTSTAGALLRPVLEVLTAAGCTIAEEKGSLCLTSDGQLRAVPDIETGPYPGFPTDAQALVMAALLRAEGETRFSETVFERRFGHVAQLRRFGGRIETLGPTALVRGTDRLRGAAATGSDLRASAALLLAALQAPEESRIFGLKHLDRGYDTLEEKFRSLGADLERLR